MSQANQNASRLDHSWIIARFGGVRPLAEALGHAYPTTVQAWKRRKVIPVRQIPAVISAAAACGLALKPEDFFAAEPGARVEVTERADRVEIDVRECPAIRHLRAGGREIVPQFCRHCQILGHARAESAGLRMRLAGGNGACVQTYATAAAGLPPQDDAAIREATS